MSSFNSIKVAIQSRLAVITFNRPLKKNAISVDVYREMTQALNEISENDEVTITALTGTGEYYCSGTDLSNMEGATDIKSYIAEASVTLRKFIGSFIDHKKILVAVVNGPAIGIAVTTLALCDVVYCSKTATFVTPFPQLGMTCEGCSSYTFPRIMGKSKAGEMLYFNHKMDAEEAVRVGLVSHAYSREELDSVLWPKLRTYAQEIPINSLIYTKRIIRHFDTAALHEANRIEVDRLEERWQSEDFFNAIIKFMSRSKM